VAQAVITGRVISIVIPTIPGREDHYERCARAYAERTLTRFEIITEYDHPTVGRAWQAGAEKATGDYIHLTCDDLEPLAGWDAAATAMCDLGCLPAPRVTDARTGALQSRPVWGCDFPDGTECGITVVPFLSREQWEAVQPLCQIHYYSDDWISWRARNKGWPSLMCNGYAFRHHWAQHRRGAGMTEGERMIHDQCLFFEAQQMAARGEWDKPWP
jgi:hypothetical protein